MFGAERALFIYQQKEVSYNLQERYTFEDNYDTILPEPCLKEDNNGQS